MPIFAPSPLFVFLSLELQRFHVPLSQNTHKFQIFVLDFFLVLPTCFVSNPYSGFFFSYRLNSLSHTTTLHPFKLLPHPSFLNLTLFLFLRIFKMFLVTQFHQMSRFVHLTFESTNGRFNGFTISNFDSNLNGQLGCRTMMMMNQWRSTCEVVLVGGGRGCGNGQKKKNRQPTK